MFYISFSKWDTLSVHASNCPSWAWVDFSLCFSSLHSELHQGSIEHKGEAGLAGKQLTTSNRSPWPKSLPVVLISWKMVFSNFPLPFCITAFFPATVTTYLRSVQEFASFSVLQTANAFYGSTHRISGYTTVWQVALWWHCVWGWQMIWQEGRPGRD